MDTEIWKDIEGFDYEVSNFGTVRNKKTNNVLKPFLSKNNYLQVKIGNPQKNQYFHYLVAKTFLNYKKTVRNIVIDHKDNDRSNNHISNLQIVSNVVNTTKDKKNK